MNPNLDAARSLVETRIDSLKPFPQIILDIIAVLDDEDANANFLVDHLHRDPVLSGRLLGLANMAANKLPSQRTVTDVNSAVAMLGFSRIRTLVTTLTLRDAFASVTPAQMADQFWGHSVDVGTAAKVIAEHAGLKADVAYIAGLLHDIGVLWIATNFPLEFAKMSALLEGPEHHIIGLERKIIGADHASIGAVLAEIWGLPEKIGLPIAGHHNPDDIPPSPYVMCVHLAEMACNSLELGKRSRSIVSYLSEQTLPLLNLEWSQVPHLLGEIEARARFMRAFTGISSN
jgi:putative nucleotidyltransferase with HDIG domain